MKDFILKLKKSRKRQISIIVILMGIIIIVTLFIRDRASMVADASGIIEETITSSEIVNTQEIKEKEINTENKELNTEDKKSLIESETIEKVTVEVTEKITESITNKTEEIVQNPTVVIEETKAEEQKIASNNTDIREDQNNNIQSSTLATSYIPMDAGWVVYQTASNNISDTQKSYINDMVSNWTSGNMDDVALESQIANYLKSQNISYHEVMATSKVYCLYKVAPDPQLYFSKNTYTFVGLYSTGNKNSGSDHTICYKWTIFIL